MSTPTVLFNSSGAMRSNRPSPSRSAAPIEIGHFQVRLGRHPCNENQIVRRNHPGRTDATGSS
jgi:hypothetical protein